MKIGIDIRAIGQQRTGDEYYTLNLVRNLLKIDKKNQYFLFTNTNETKKIKEKILAGLNNKNIEVVSVLPSFKLFWTIFLLPRVAKRLNLDVLHVQYIAPLGLSQKTKLITTIADVSFKAYPELIKKTDLFFLNLLIPLSLRKADKIVAVSKFTKNEIIKYYKTKAEKIKVVYNGEASEIFKKENINSENILEKIGIKKPYLFYIGTHQPRKDIPTLIEAFLLLKKQEKKFENLQLVIGGKLKAHNYDPKIDLILSEAKKDQEDKKFIKDIIFTGYLENEELVSLYKEAEIFVFPSLYEGFGLPLIEAMVSETPVVCSDIECFKEVAGEAGEFYQAGDVEELKKALLKLLDDSKRRNDLVKKGREQAKKYSWKKTAEKMLKIFLE